MHYILALHPLEAIHPLDAQHILDAFHHLEALHPLYSLLPLDVLKSLKNETLSKGLKVPKDHALNVYTSDCQS